MKRPSKLWMMMQIAQVVSTRSTCARLQVGCILTNLEDNTNRNSTWDERRSHTRILAMGYNGMESGGKNECDSSEPGQCGCIHAEMNALIKAPPGPKAVFVTTSPCLMCSRLMINADVRQVFYGKEYRRNDGIRLLMGHHVDVFHLDHG
jgi:dCMP deaminase